MNSTENDIQQEIETLQQRREELRNRLAKIENDYRSGLSADAEEQAIELENAEVLEAIAKATTEELADIEARLADLE